MTPLQRRALLIAGAAVTVIVFALGYELRRPGAAYSPIPSLNSSAIAKSLADKIAPVLQANVTQRKEEIIASAGGWSARTAVRVGFPVGVREIPTLTEVGAEAMLDHLGSLSLSELSKTLTAHNRARGRPSHPSLTKAAH